MSHLHRDHFGGLPFLVLDGQFTNRTRPFPVHFHELADRQPRQFEPAGLVLVPYEVVHASGAPALALQVAWQGHTIAYTGDTEWTQALVELASGAELLIAEGYTYQRKIRFHLDVAPSSGGPARWKPAGSSSPTCPPTCWHASMSSAGRRQNREATSRGPADRSKRHGPGASEAGGRPT